MTSNPARSLGVAVIGFGWMGRVHTESYSRIRHHFPTLGLHPRLVAVADEVPGRPEEAAAQFGFAKAVSNWRDLLTDPEVDLISVTAPNFLHREIGVAVAEAGKHLWIEKPVGLVTQDAVAVRDAARTAGIRTQVGFNYRNAPAVQHAVELIRSGAIGTVTHASVRLLSDYAAHPDGALSWRFSRQAGGNGVLGDLMSHGVDLAATLLGPITEVVADTAIFLDQRPIPTGATAGHQRASGGELGPVENEDWISALAHTATGARVHLEASRVAVGDQNNYGFVVHGTAGQLAWDFRRMGELVLSAGGDSPAYQDQTSTTLFVGPGHGDYAAFQPGSGISMGYGDLKIVELRNLLLAIESGQDVGATLDDAVRSSATLDAMSASVESRGWVDVAQA